MEINKQFEMLPNFGKIFEFVDEVKKYVFVGYFEKVCCEKDNYIKEKQDMIRFLFSHYISSKGEDIILSLDKLEKDMRADLDYYLASDPAIEGEDEVIFAYPGYLAIFYYRLANILYKMNIEFIPRIITEKAHSLTGIDIHPGAEIGVPFFIDHGTGIVIGQTSVIGKYVKMYHGVTLGALSLKGGHSLYGVKRHPTIKDYVTIYSGASILGGETIIGEHVTVGSNVFIVNSVLENTKVIYSSNEIQFIKK